MASAFGSDNDAWVEDYSHAGGFQGLRWLRISSTSSAKSGSRTGALPVSSSCALANAMHSEMLRRTGSAVSRTATGRAPFSMMTFAPARTRAINEAIVVRCFRLGDVNHVLSHKGIIHRFWVERR